MAVLTTTIDPRADAIIARASEMATGWARVAEFFDANPDLAALAHVYEYSVLITDISDKAAQVVPGIGRRVRDAADRAEMYDDGDHCGWRMWFGRIFVQVYARTSLVAEQVADESSEWRQVVSLHDTKQAAAVNS